MTCKGGFSSNSPYCFGIQCHFFQTMDPASQTMDRASQTMNRASQTMNRASQTMDRASQTMNWASQTMGWATQTMNWASQTMGRASQTMNRASQTMDRAGQTTSFHLGPSTNNHQPATSYVSHFTFNQSELINLKINSGIMKKIIALALVLLGISCHSKEKEVNLPHIKKAVTMEKQEKIEVATFAGGCFWCTEALFLELNGVKSIVSGYTGGTIPNPTYAQVCSGVTGHAEAVQITYDANKISFGELLEVFFATHDPTTLNRQGNDVGTQYRSEVFYHNPEQKKITESYIALLQSERTFADPIVTKVSPFTTFYPAENYHQNYYNQNKEQSYCHFVITPKVEKFEKKYKDKLKK